MKTFLLVICLLANVAWAEADGGVSIEVVPRKPHLQERFQFQTTLFLDRATFGWRQIFLLDLKNLIPRMAQAAGDGVSVEFRMQQRREGLRVPITINGSGDEMLAFFDSLLSKHLVPVAYMGGVNPWAWPWAGPSKEYERYWIGINNAIKNEIEFEAIAQGLNVCEEAMNSGARD